MDRDTAVRTWRDVCGSDTMMAMGVVTGRMLEDFAARIEAAECERCAKLCDMVWFTTTGHQAKHCADAIRGA